MPYSRRTFLRSAAFVTGIAGVLTCSRAASRPPHRAPRRPSAIVRRRSPDPPPRHFSASSSAAAPSSMASINDAKACHALTFDIGREPPPNLNFFGGFFMPVRSRRSFLTALFAVSLLSGCALKRPLKAPNSFAKTAKPLQRKPSVNPPRPLNVRSLRSRRLRPGTLFRTCFFCRRLLMLQLLPRPADCLIRFSPKAAQHGAPTAVPPLHCDSALCSGQRQLRFSPRSSMTVWRISWDGSTISKHEVRVWMNASPPNGFCVT